MFRSLLFKFQTELFHAFLIYNLKSTSRTSNLPLVHRPNKTGFEVQIKLVIVQDLRFSWRCLWRGLSSGIQSRVVALLATCLHAGLLLGLFFDPQDESNMFLRNVSWLSALYPRRRNASYCSVQSRYYAIRAIQTTKQHPLLGNRLLISKNKQPLLSNAFANKHVQTEKTAVQEWTVFLTRSVPRCYNRGKL
jgi:hypothetical protein